MGSGENQGRRCHRETISTVTIRRDKPPSCRTNRIWKHPAGSLKLYLSSVAVLLSLRCFASSNSRISETDWPFYGRDPGGMRYSPLKQINRSNVRQLVRKWTYHTGEQISSGEGRHRLVPFECTPLVVDGTLYLSTPSAGGPMPPTKLHVVQN